jgi:hypothetical protein
MCVCANDHTHTHIYKYVCDMCIFPNSFQLLPPLNYLQVGSLSEGPLQLRGTIRVSRVVAPPCDVLDSEDGKSTAVSTEGSPVVSPVATIHGVVP